MQHSILYLYNPKDFVKIRNRSTQTKPTEQKKKKKKSIEEKQTHNIKFYTQTYKIEEKMYRCRCRFRRSDGLNLEMERMVVGKLMVMANL